MHRVRLRILKGWTCVPDTLRDVEVYYYLFMTLRTFLLKQWKREDNNMCRRFIYANLILFVQESVIFYGGSIMNKRNEKNYVNRVILTYF